MFNFKKFKNEKWYDYAVALCIAILFFFILKYLYLVVDILKYIWNVISPIVVGFIIAYLMNPLCNTFYKIISLGKNERINPKTLEKIRQKVSIIAAYIFMMLILMGISILIVPQILESVGILISNISIYTEKLQKLLNDLNFSGGLYAFTNNTKFINYITENANLLLSKSFDASEIVSDFIISIILAVYINLNKDFILKAFKILSKKIIPKTQYDFIIKLISHTDNVFTKYIIYNIFEAIGVGLANFIFMFLFKMPFSVLISVFVGITNLVPTFGPIVGCLVGMFILLLESPKYVIFFLIFTIILQTIDGYIIKPKLYGSKFGIPDIIILMAMVICGKMFGIIGMLISIPLSAIFVYIGQAIKINLELKKES